MNTSEIIYKTAQLDELNQKYLCLEDGDEKDFIKIEIDNLIKELDNIKLIV